MNHILEIIENLIEEDVGKILPVSGGSISNAYRILTSKREYFLKVNEEIPHDNFFYIEAKTLEILADTSTFKVPKVFKYGKHYLVTEFIKEEAPTETYWKTFAEKLAQLHQYSADYFGLEFDNYIGSLKQENTPCVKWSEFFATKRILPLLRKAYDLERIDGKLMLKVELFCSKLDDLFPSEKPALIHGDLWSGNFMNSNGDEPVIFDPAIYFGNREMDLAMTRLFGKMDPRFYEHYNTIYPLEKKWKERVKYCNTYPLLIHLLLFGGGYAKEIDSALKDL